MKITKRILTVIMAVAVVAACFAGCSKESSEKYGKEVAILGYTQESAPFLTDVKDGEASGFEAELWEAIFDSVKGDLKSYRFEQVEEGYTLEESGGFFDSNDMEYSACLMFGGVSKNYGTFNEDYSYTQPIITNRVIAIVPKDSAIKSYADFEGVRVAVTSNIASEAFNQHSAISSVCSNVAQVSLTAAMDYLGKTYDVIITDEFTYCPTEQAKSEAYTVLDGELDTIEYVIACAKNSGWMWSINEAIREMKSESYGDGDEFTPLVEKYFGYNASSFEYTTDGDN